MISVKYTVLYSLAEYVLVLYSHSGLYNKALINRWIVLATMCSLSSHKLYIICMVELNTVQRTYLMIKLYIYLYPALNLTTILIRRKQTSILYIFRNKIIYYSSSTAMTVKRSKHFLISYLP